MEHVAQVALERVVAQQARGISRAIPVWWGLARSPRSVPMGGIPVRSEVTTVGEGLRWVSERLPAAARDQPVPRPPYCI